MFTLVVKVDGAVVHASDTAADVVHALFNELLCMRRERATRSRYRDLHPNEEHINISVQSTSISISISSI